MDLSHANLAIFQLNLSDSLQFPPSSATELLSQERKNSDFVSDGDTLYIRNSTEYFEVPLQQHHRRAF